MDKRSNRILAILVMLFLALHFLASAVIQIPGKFLGEAAHNVAWHYIRPAFAQNWKLFAPSPPKTDKTIFIRWQDGNEMWSEWQNPAWDWSISRRKNPISPDVKLYQLTQNIGHYILQDVSYVRAEIGAADIHCRHGMSLLEQGFGYYLCKNFAVQKLATEEGEAPVKFQFALAFKDRSKADQPIQAVIFPPINKKD